MSLKVTVVRDDVAVVPSDLLVLKYAREFFGADEAVSSRLIQQGACEVSSISPDEGDFALVDSRGAVKASRVFLGLAHHRCIFYKTIGKLAQSLESTILDAFGQGAGDRDSAN